MMFRRSRAHGWLCFALLAFLATRVSDAHVHLCFDGLEPATAVHMADGSVHNDAHHADAEHTDKDVDLPSALLIKKGGDSSDLDAPVVNTMIVWAPVDAGPAQAIAAHQPAPAHPPFRLKPPLRGPPR